MNLKQIIGSAALVLPLAITSLPTQASALEVIVKPRVYNHSAKKIRVTPARRVVRPRVVRTRVVRPRVNQRVWIPARWENRRQGRRWVPGHYQYR